MMTAISKKVFLVKKNSFLLCTVNTEARLKVSAVKNVNLDNQMAVDMRHSPVLTKED